jgi:hypothetical protein
MDFLFLILVQFLKEIMNIRINNNLNISPNRAPYHKRTPCIILGKIKDDPITKKVTLNIGESLILISSIFLLDHNKTVVKPSLLKSPLLPKSSRAFR